jgi:hypothetical protein
VQGLYESITAYKEQSNNALKAYLDQQNLMMREKYITMDFSMGDHISNQK